MFKTKMITAAIGVGICFVTAGVMLVLAKQNLDAREALVGLTVVPIAAGYVFLWWGASVLDADISDSVAVTANHQDVLNRHDRDRARPPMPAEVRELMIEHDEALADAIRALDRAVTLNSKMRDGMTGLAERLRATEADRDHYRAETERAKRAFALWNGEIEIAEVLPEPPAGTATISGALAHDAPVATPQQPTAIEPFARRRGVLMRPRVVDAPPGPVNLDDVGLLRRVERELMGSTAPAPA